jgi:hypothetical protein
MNKLFIISMGLAAAGTTSLHAAYAPDLNPMETSKIWSVAGTLRGFYDDNYTTSPNGDKQGSGGFEVSPSVQLSVPLQQTEFALKYTYGLYYYQARQNDGNDPYDQTHQMDLWVDHAFSERWQATLHDTLAIGQEPELINPGPGGTPQPFRVNGNNIANYATAALTTDWTRLFSTVLTYNNGYYQFQQSGGDAAAPSQNGLLTRLDQSIGLDLQWSVAPETIVLVGYQFEFVNFWGNEVVAQNPPPPAVATQLFYSDSRNTYSHIPYVGFQHQFLPNLNVSAKVGAEYTENYNDSSSPNFVTPWVLSSASYTYAPGSYAQLGFTHSQNATYVIAQSSTGQITQSQQSSVITASVNQSITAKLTGSVIGTVQLSRYNQGAFNNNEDEDYALGLNLTYAFNQHFSTEVGYNFDLLQSNVPGNAYSRNRVYLGVTAAY